MVALAIIFPSIKGIGIQSSAMQISRNIPMFFVFFAILIFVGILLYVVY